MYLFVVHVLHSQLHDPQCMDLLCCLSSSSPKAWWELMARPSCQCRALPLRAWWVWAVYHLIPWGCPCRCPTSTSYQRACPATLACHIRVRSKSYQPGSHQSPLPLWWLVLTLVAWLQKQNGSPSTQGACCLVSCLVVSWPGMEESTCPKLMISARNGTSWKIRRSTLHELANHGYIYCKRALIYELPVLTHLTTDLQCPSTVLFLDWYPSQCWQLFFLKWLIVTCAPGLIGFGVVGFRCDGTRCKWHGWQSRPG